MPTFQPTPPTPLPTSLFFVSYFFDHLLHRIGRVIDKAIGFATYLAEIILLGTLHLAGLIGQLATLILKVFLRLFAGLAGRPVFVGNIGLQLAEFTIDFVISSSGSLSKSCRFLLKRVTLLFVSLPRSLFMSRPRFDSFRVVDRSVCGYDRPIFAWFCLSIPDESLPV